MDEIPLSKVAVAVIKDKDDDINAHEFIAGVASAFISDLKVVQCTLRLENVDFDAFIAAIYENSDGLYDEKVDRIISNSGRRPTIISSAIQLKNACNIQFTDLKQDHACLEFEIESPEYRNRHTPQVESPNQKMQPVILQATPIPTTSTSALLQNLGTIQMRDPHTGLFLSPDEVSQLSPTCAERGSSGNSRPQEVQIAQSKSRKTENIPITPTTETEEDELGGLLRDDSETEGPLQTIGASGQVQNEEAVRRTRASINTKQLAHLDMSLLKRTNMMFLQPNDLSNDKAEYHVKGLKKPLKPYQALTIRWMFEVEWYNGGLFLCHEPGLGKTAIEMAYAYLSACYAQNVNDVLKEQHRRAGEGGPAPFLHRQPGHDRGQPCPSQDRLPFQCSCVEEGVMTLMKKPHLDLGAGTSSDPLVLDDDAKAVPVTRGWIQLPPLGINLWFVPAGLISSWRKEFGLFFHEENPYVEMKLWVGHRDADKPANRSLAGKSIIEANTDDNRWSGMYAKHATEQKCPPKSREHIILTSPDSFTPWVTDKIGGNFRVGRVVFDEQHKQYKHTSKIISHLNALRTRQGSGDLLYHGLSGTPMKPGPAGIIEYVKHLHAVGHWENHHVLTRMTLEGLERFVIQYKNIIRGRHPDSSTSSPMLPLTVQVVRNFARELAEWFTGLMIRQAGNTKWFNGERCLELPAYQHRTVAVVMSSRWRDRQRGRERLAAERYLKDYHKLHDDWVNKAKKGDEPAQTLDLLVNIPEARMARNTCNVPYFIEFVENGVGLGSPCRLTQEELKSKGTPNALAVMKRSVSEMLNSSPKLQFVIKQAKKLKAKSNSISGEVLGEEKMVVIADDLYTCQAAKMVLKQAGMRAELFDPTITLEARDQILDRFTDAKDESEEEFAYPDNERPQVLVGTLRTLGTGYNLQRANVLIILGAQYSVDDVAQCLKRVVRTGQQRQTETFYVFDKSCMIDQVVMRKAALKELLKIDEDSVAVLDSSRGSIIAPTSPRPQKQRTDKRSLFNTAPESTAEDDSGSKRFKIEHGDPGLRSSTNNEEQMRSGS